jgi:pyrroloquinoline quinone biosynthesis protein D
MASPGRIPDAGGVIVAPPLDSSRPGLAVGCRWGSHGEEPVVLYPEGMIKLQETGRSILELCDGKRTVQEIVASLALRFTKADPAKIRVDVGAFLESLQEKRIVDY